MLVRELMNAEVVAVDPHCSLRQALETMEVRRIHHLLVENRASLLGVITHRDIRATLPPWLSAAEAAERRQLLDTVPVSALCVVRPLTIAPDVDARQAALLMRQRHIGCLPVVEQGHVVGIITEADFLDAFIRFSGGEAIPGHAPTGPMPRVP
ncbi:MAG: CBS domain-containing protein [Deltaproteobacteria bacterium]|nr:CBS domain-containing protein [Deltaproteobacteria bacterium]